MNTLATLTAVAVASVSVAGSRLASADRTKPIQVRQINTAPRVIGCSSDLESCDGVTSIRTGLVVIDVESHYLRRGPVSLVGMFQASAQPKGALLASQLMLGGGPRFTFGHSWVQAGLGLAGSQVDRGPRTIPATSLLLDSRMPAAMVGVGTFVKLCDVPLQLSVDVGSNFAMFGGAPFDDIYQVTANVLATGL